MDFATVQPDEVITQTKAALEKHGMNVEVVSNKQAALEWLKKNIPQRAKVMNGSSTTLAEIGFVDYLKANQHGWNNLHEEILKEQDYAKQSELRRKALVDTDYFLASANAITQDGQVVAVDNTGSRVGAFPFAAKKLVLVVGAQKITKDVSEAMQRIKEYVFPLEDKRMIGVYGFGSGYGKWVIIEQERTPNRIQILIVKEKLGF